MTVEKTIPKGRSLGLVGVAYVVAIAVAAAWLVWGVPTGRLWLDTLIADVLATLAVFVFSRAFGNSSFYDAYWSVVPPLLLFYWWSQSGVHQLRCWLIAAVVVVAASELLRGVQFLGSAGAVRCRRRALGRLVGVLGGAGDAGHVPRRQHSDDGDAQSAAASGLSGRDRPGITFCVPSSAKGDGVSSAGGRM
jgi:hypothetical protein